MTTPKEIVDAIEAELESTRHRVGVYGWSPGSGGVHHHRIGEPLRVLREHGVHVATGVELDDDILNRCDTVLVHTLHGERESEAWRTLERLDSHRLVLDVDDAMWAPDFPAFRDHYTPEVLGRLYDNIRRAHVVTTPSEVIADHLLDYNPNVHVVPNTVPEWILGHRMPERARRTVGYQGSHSHARDWAGSAQIQLFKFLRDHEHWGLAVYGSDRPASWPESNRVQFYPWSGSVDAYYRSLSMDVMIGPLRDTAFNRAKSSLRAVEAAAFGIVAVLPDLEPYRGWVEDGVTGRLVHRYQTMRQVLTEVAAMDPEELGKMAARARDRAESWTTEASIGRWVEAWNSQ